MAFSFSTMSSLLSLAPSGVFQRSLLPIEPVCSYHTFSPLPCYGGLFSVALSLGLPPPGITWHCILAEPGLSPKEHPEEGDLKDDETKRVTVDIDLNDEDARFAIDESIAQASFSQNIDRASSH